MSQEKKRVFVVDGYGQIYRSYFAFIQNPLKDKDGNNVSAIFGFFNIIMMLVRQYKPDYLVVALDSKGKTFRHEMYPLYKANREKTPEDLHAQIPVIERMLDSMNIPHIARVGMEADDIIATIARNNSINNLETVMVTGDKDLMQLVDDSTFALRPPKKGEHEYRLCKAEEVKEIFGVRPDQICDYLTILGDTSDNVPGITGIGEKGAINILSKYETLENAYAHIDEFSKGIKTKLDNARDSIGLSHKLIELKNDIFDYSEIDIDEYTTDKINWLNAIQEFYSIGSDSLVRTAKKFLMPGHASESKEIEKHTGFSQFPVRSVQTSDNEEIVVPDDFTVNTEDYCNLVGYDIKTKIKELSAQGIGANPCFDVMIAAWLLDSSDPEPSLEDICIKHLGSSDFDEKEALRRLVYVLTQKLKKQNLYSVFTDMEMPLISVLAQMESNGIIIDPQRLSKYREELEKSISTIENDIYTLCGHEFNIGSPKQLQEVLFNERKLPPVKKTKSGYSTDSDVLEELSYSTEDPVPSLILKYRGLTKLLSTYVIPLPSLADEGGRIHTSFLQTGTATGRLSSKNPNLQNIPIRTDEGRRIRDSFIPKDGCVLMSADYSQIELAVMASISKDRALCDAFIKGDDVHTRTASLIFSQFPEMVTPSQRRIAKTINFGVIYGMSAFRLAQDLKITRKEAQNFIDTYFEQYIGVKDFIEKTKSEAAEKLCVSTMMGHIRNIPEMASSNKIIKSAAERVAVNSVIQGSAAEIVKLAMLKVYTALKEKNLKSKILLQVHDEIILEVPLEEKDAVKDLVRSCMEGLNKLDVPLRVGIETGSSWGEMH